MVRKLPTRVAVVCCAPVWTAKICGRITVLDTRKREHTKKLTTFCSGIYVLEVLPCGSQLVGYQRELRTRSSKNFAENFALELGQYQYQ